VGAARRRLQGRQRPELVLLGGALVVPVAVFIGLLARYHDWPAAVWIGAAVVVVLVAVAGAAVAWDDGPRRSAALGAATVAIVSSALLVAGAVLLTQRPATGWQRFALVAGTALAALLLASVDWSRRWLLRLTLLVVAAVVVLLVQIGHADLERAHDRKVLLSLADARHEAEGLDAVTFAPPENPEPAQRPQAKANFDAALDRACRAARAEGVLDTPDEPEPIQAALDGCGTGTERAGSTMRSTSCASVWPGTGSSPPATTTIARRSDPPSLTSPSSGPPRSSRQPDADRPP
jgi:hypothetical protein